MACLFKHRLEKGYGNMVSEDLLKVVERLCTPKEWDKLDANERHDVLMFRYDLRDYMTGFRMQMPDVPEVVQKAGGVENAC